MLYSSKICEKWNANESVLRGKLNLEHGIRLILCVNVEKYYKSCLHFVRVESRAFML